MIFKRSLKCILAKSKGKPFIQEQIVHVRDEKMRI